MKLRRTLFIYISFNVLRVLFELMKKIVINNFIYLRFV